MITDGKSGKMGNRLEELQRLLKEYDYLKRGVKKNELFFGLVIGLWLACLFYFDPQLFKLYEPTDPLFVSAAIVFTIACLNIFWFYTSYLVVMFFFTFFKKFPYLSPPPLASPAPKVAFLYTTVNDFNYKSVMTCLEQDYPDFHLFMLDDSKDEASKAEVDGFHAKFPDKTTVVRRKDRKGFKAGAINNCMSNYAKDYKYFAVADSDSIFPPDFLSKAVRFFGLDENIGFVQCSHLHNPNQEGRFARDLGMGVNIHWRRFQPPRNRYGFVMFFGHAGIIRRDVWEEVGGFPEIVCEDLAFSCVVRQHGYYGFFIPDVVCYEDFPDSMMVFRKRHYRWVKGTIEYAFWGLPDFMKAKSVNWSEKMDVFLICLGITFPTLLLLFTLVSAFLTFAIGIPEDIAFNIFGIRVSLWPMYMVPRFTAYTSGMDFYILTVVAIFAPVFFMVDLGRNPVKITKFFAQATTAYPAMIVLSAVSTFSIFITGKAYFTVTGAKVAQQEEKAPAKGFSFVEWVNKLNSDNKFVIGTEIAIALFLTWYCLMSLNIGLLTISLGIIINVLTAIYGWENKYLYPLTFVPGFFVVLAMGMIGISQLAITPILYALIPVHM